MISLTLKSIAEATNGKLLGDDRVVHEINTDTRVDSCDQLFVALKGCHFDAHDFIADAVKQGAVALVVEALAFEKESVAAVCKALPCVVVENSRIALGSIAKYIRQQSNAKFVGLTGSVGKTTVKEMTASVLNQYGSTLATQGNFNNDIGVPLTLFRLKDEDEFAVVEMGANHAGEIAYTSSIVEPDVALINNVAAAHLEGFGDLQGIAQAKGEIYNGLNADGIAIINNDDVFASYWLKNIKQKTISFAIEHDADLVAENLEMDRTGAAKFEVVYKGSRYPVTLKVPGKHNVSNALAVLCICLSLDLSLEKSAEALSSFGGVQGRLSISRFGGKFTVVDDTYNANYSSLKAAIDVITHYDGIKYLVLGDMGELGSEAREYHEKAGLAAKRGGFDYLLTVGELSQFASDAFGENAYHFSSHQELTHWLIEKLKETAGTALLKGSRSARMEEVVKPVLDWASNNYGRAS